VVLCKTLRFFGKALERLPESTGKTWFRDLKRDRITSSKSGRELIIAVSGNRSIRAIDYPISNPKSKI
jgi:hypothetical protein